MRVLTAFGFGTVDDSVAGYDRAEMVSVHLDEPTKFARHQRLFKKRVYSYAPYGFLRIIRIDDAQAFSSLRFERSEEIVRTRMGFAPAENEDRLFVNLETGTFACDQAVGLWAQDYLVLDMCVGRWCLCALHPCRSVGVALDEYQALCPPHGECDVWAKFALDMARQRIMWADFYARLVTLPVLSKHF